MAIKALTVNDTFEYVSDTDPCKKRTEVPVDPKDPKKGTRTEITIEPGATIFGLKTLDVFLMGHIYDSSATVEGKAAAGSIGINMRMNQTSIEAVRFGLAYLKNFKDEAGNDVSVTHVDAVVNGRTYKAASDETLSRLGIRLVQELATQIKERSEVSEADAKN